MWDLPGPGLKPVSPVLAGRFLTTAPPGKSLDIISSNIFSSLFSLLSFWYSSYVYVGILMLSHISLRRSFSFSSVLYLVYTIDLSSSLLILSSASVNPVLGLFSDFFFSVTVLFTSKISIWFFFFLIISIFVLIFFIWCDIVIKPCITSLNMVSFSFLNIFIMTTLKSVC